MVPPSIAERFQEELFAQTPAAQRGAERCGAATPTHDTPRAC